MNRGLGFLDDLQWLDAATLDLMEDLLSRSDLQNLCNYLGRWVWITQRAGRRSGVMVLR